MKTLIRYVLNQRGKKNVVILIAVFLLFVAACGSNEIQDGEEALPATETAEESNNFADIRSHSMRTPFLLTIPDADKQLTSEIQALSKITFNAVENDIYAKYLDEIVSWRTREYYVNYGIGSVAINYPEFSATGYIIVECGTDLLLQMTEQHAF